MSRWSRHIVLDVESDGPVAGLFNMISFGLVSLTDPAMAFHGEVAPVLESAGVPRAREVVGISHETQKGFRTPELVMRDAVAWVDGVTRGERAVFWSDNPAFDWQFWNWYCHRLLGDNPGGFSAPYRRSRRRTPWRAAEHRGVQEASPNPAHAQSRRRCTG